MLKRQWSGMLAAAGAALMISGCGGGGGGSAPPPVLLSAVPGDSQVTLTWAPAPGVYYWVWWLQSVTNVIIGESGNAVDASINAISPYVLSPVVNGLPYSFAVNAHAGSPNGPGGAQSNTLTATPRYAGSTWEACTASGNTCPTGAPTLYGVGFGDNIGLLASDNGSMRDYLAVGAGGSMFVSLDAHTWTALPAQAACTPPSGGALRTADYGWGTYVAAGDSGTLCFSGLTPTNPTGLGLAFVTNPATAGWYKATTVPATLGTPNFYAVATNQNNVSSPMGVHVLVGSAGTILYSPDGQNWFAPAASTIPAKDLYGVSANFCGMPFWTWLAVGANGTILGTADPGGTVGWTSVGITSNTTQNLRGVACTLNSTPSTVPLYPPLTLIPLWVAAGDGGVLLTSTDGLTWTTPANFKIDGVAVTAFPVGIKALTFGTQFVAVGDSGAVFTSFDGASWTSQTSNAGGNTLYAITQPPGGSLYGTIIPNGYMGAVPYGYAAVGAGGITTFGR